MPSGFDFEILGIGLGRLSRGYRTSEISRSFLCLSNNLMDMSGEGCRGHSKYHFQPGVSVSMYGGPLLS